MGPVVLIEKVRGYERELVCMMAEDARFRETIAVKEKHVRKLQNLLQTWSATTLSERRRFGDYYTQEDIRETLQRQMKTMRELRATLNCLKYEVETLRRRISSTWEMIERVETKEKEPVCRGDDSYMMARGNNDNSMQVDT